jgi:arylformamidase
VWDLTLPITEEMRSWPGTPEPRQQWLERIADGDLADVSAWTIGSHAGTHIDAPSHFLPDAPDLESIPLETLIGRCVVVDFEPLEHSAWAGYERVLFKAQSGITLDAARVLIERGVKLVGVDALSIEASDSVNAGAPVHRQLLQANVVVLEGLALFGVPPGEYTLVALPPRFQHSEASPARVVLLDLDAL